MQDQQNEFDPIDDSDESEADSDAPLYDENAFGLYVSWFDAEEVEYSQSSDKFPPRILVFRSAVQEYLQSHPLGEGATALDLGTSIYLEVADGDQTEDIIGWVRGFRSYLDEGDWTTFAVMTHGGRWVAKEPSAALPAQVGSVKVAVSMGPSEPFLKAMAAQGLAHDDEDSGEVGWGSGLFVDADVLEALNRRLKNQPTALRCAGTSYYRLGG